MRSDHSQVQIILGILQIVNLVIGSEIFLDRKELFFGIKVKALDFPVRGGISENVLCFELIRVFTPFYACYRGVVGDIWVL